MKKTLIRIIGLIGLSAIIWFAVEHKQNLIFVSNQQLNQDFFYDSQPISDKCMEKFVGYLMAPDIEDLNIKTCLAEEKEGKLTNLAESIFKWNYIGTLTNGDHIIYTYSWPQDATGKFSTISIIRREGDIFKYINFISGGDRHASMIMENSWSLEGNKLVYGQHMTSYSLLTNILDMSPELKLAGKQQLIESSCQGEACYIGHGKFEAIITPDNKLNVKLLSFVSDR